MQKIVFLDRETVQANFRPPGFAHQWIDYATTTPAELPARLQAATIAITNKIPLRKAVLAQLPSLKLIVVAATGYDCVDVNFCRTHNIAVCNVRNYSSQSVAEHVMMLLFNLARNFPAYQADVKNGEWQRASTFCLNTHAIKNLRGSTLGIIGNGAIGQAVAHLASAFGMKTLIAERKGAIELRAGRVSFEEVMQTSDAISLHCPLTAETRNFIGEAEFLQMKPTAILLNAGRGGLVDEAALVAALQAREIAAAGIDVLTKEPPADGNPLLEINLPNLIVTPHNAWASAQSQQILAEQMVDILEAFSAGSAKNLVW